MGRKTNRQRAKRVQQANSDGPIFTSHPLAGIPKEILRPAIIEMGKRATSDLPDIREKTMEAFKACSPLYFLTGITQSALMIGVHDDGSFVKKNKKNKLEQFHVELAQAIFLSIRREDIRWDGLNPHSVQECADLLLEYVETSQKSRLINLENATEEQIAFMSIQERIRLHTIAVRNWGYYQQVIRILKELYTPIDNEIFRAHGIKASSLIDIFDYILRSIERRTNEFIYKMQIVFSRKNNIEIIRTYHHEFNLNNSEEFLQVANSWSRAQLTFAIVSHAQIHAQDIYTFSLEDIAKNFEKEEIDVKKITDLLSIPFGGLTEYQHERIFLSNPIWEKPLIETGDGHFFAFIPQLFFGHSFHIFGNLFDRDARAKSAHEIRRAKFLEDEIAKAFHTAFGDQQLERNVKWRHDHGWFETDLLIAIDSRLFIVEAKSHRISWPALRGAPDRMRRQIKETLVEPATQAERLKKNLEKWLSGENIDFEIKSEIDFSQIKNISKISITLEDFATIQSNLQSLSEAGLIDKDAPFSVTMSLADLQIVFDIITTPVERIHYLMRRDEIQKRMPYIADEIDLLGLYLKTGFELGEAEAGEVGIISVGMSEPVDHYFQLLDQGLPATKPRREMTQWFQDMRDRLSAVSPKGWIDVALMLMSVGLDDQKAIERHFQGVRRALKKIPSSTPDKLNTTAVTPPAWRRLGLAFVAFHEQERQDRHAIMESSAIKVFEDSHAERCLVVACDLEGRDYPYTSLGLFDRPADFLSIGVGTP